jgi:cell division protein FtsB
MAAIKGLYQIVQEKDADIAALRQQNTALEARIAALEQAIGRAVPSAPPDAAVSWNVPQP